MIGEKRKRYQMDLRMNEQQQQQRQVPEQSSSSSVRQEDRSQHPGSHQIHQPIPSDRGRIIPIESGFGREIFVDSKKVSEAQKTSWAAQDHHQQHHQQQQQHLTHQERMQLELANSSHATIHQPPIRLSFPINHEDHIISAAEESDHAPAMPSSAEDSSEYHLSRELRRISLEASRGSGGLYRRKSDAASRIMDRRASGGASGRPSLEGGRVDADNNLEYYPFTRSQAPTNAPNNSSAGISTSVPTKDRDRDVMIASSGMMEIEESNDRRRSGSFIPLDMDHQSFKRTTAPKSSWLTSKPTAESTLNSKSATSTSKPRPKGPVTIDHTLTLSDL
ncbi:hypothetical protein B0O80DRAFT_43471 [Mortierella sp. GBAus27b]|nr:hypothetical protein B0O80DRAFT_43471 [Mortierella sp. GBAus27b]